MKQIFSTLLFAALPLMATAQVNITFETQDYKSIGVYDTWANSPFRTGELKGNVAVVNNDQLNGVDDLYKMAPNTSKKILALQRSRFGSNTFGARIDLNQTFELTYKTHYVHCLLWKPTAGRVMAVGLGKRPERAGQSAETEQFWMLSTNTAQAGHWTDMVFAVNGAGGIDIHSLVIIPDCEPTHNLTEDFACYIDNVCVNYDASPSLSTEFYPINAGSDTQLSRSDRYGTSITLSGSKDGSQTQSLNQQTDKRLYQNFLSKQFTAHAGETLTPSVGYNGTWMSAYSYIDFGMDSRFESSVNDNGTIPEGSDLVSYSYFNGYNSKGQTVANGNTLTMPAFTLPSDLAEGYYRMRYKVDWNDINAGGSTESGNDIVSNGGFIADIRLNIHSDYCTVNANQLNGDVTTTDDKLMENLQVPFGQALTIKMAPAPGFSYSGIRVRHGHNLSGDQDKYGTAQWEEVKYPSYLFVNDQITLPAEIMDGDVQIEGYFIQKKDDEDQSGVDYKINFDESETVESPLMTTFTVTGTKDRTYTVGGTRYQSFTSSNQSVPVLPGSIIKAKVRLENTQKQAYLYLDLNQDGHFTTGVEADGTPTLNGEVISYSYYNGHNSAGEEVTTAPDTITSLPPFTIPSVLPKGVYRARLVVGPESLDPTQGDYVADFLVNVYNETQKLEVFSPNGRIISSTAANGVPETVAPYNSLGLKFAASVPNTTAGKAGYVQQRMTVRRGQNLDGPQYVHGNCQWWQYGVAARTSYTIPADTISGDMRITAPWEGDGTQNYRLVFDEEFDEGTTPDAKVWQTPDRKNNAWARYISSDPRVAYVEDGHLVCRAMATPSDLTSENQPMISGAVQSYGAFSFQYGYIECRAKNNPFVGNFPAIWMMPNDFILSGDWPTCGEIDIWETIDAANNSTFTVHSNWTDNLGNSSNPASTSTKTNYVLDGRYHNFGLLWTADKLTWFVDGTSVFSYAKSTDATTIASGQWPFDKKYYIILNQSVGNGSWASNPDLQHVYETDFDWVRVYQLAEDSERDGNTEVGLQDILNSETDNSIYDLSGRKLNHANHPGIYISGGKKILQK